MAEPHSPVLQTNSNKPFENHTDNDQNLYDSSRNWQDSSNSSTSSPDHQDFSPAQTQQPQHPHQLPTAAQIFSSSASSEASRDPTDVLMKIFPYLDPIVLSSVLKNCQGDLLKAVEILSPHSMTRLREVKPNSSEHVETPPGSFARQLSAFTSPSRVTEQPPCTCCHRSPGINGIRKYADFMPTNRHEMMKYHQMMHRIGDHDARSHSSSNRNQECRSHMNYLFSIQDANKKFMNEISTRRHIGVENNAGMNLGGAMCVECKSPARPHDLFCRACGARISKTVHWFDHSYSSL